MKLHKKLERWTKLNGTEIKNYSEMCNILGEKKKTGEAKKNQLIRWSIYFEYEKEGHKFYISQIYDNKTVKKNEKNYEANKNLKQIVARSPYRNDLISILIYLLETAPNNELIETKTKLTALCGFFNEYMLENRKYKKYLKYKEENKTTYENKRYFKYNTDDSVAAEEIFYTYCNYIKKKSQRTLQEVLLKLEEQGILKFQEKTMGVIKNKPYVLTYEEYIEYLECKNEACKEILPLYNEKVKEKKEVIEEKDFIFMHSLREKYYDILGKIIRQEFEYDAIMDYYSIYLIKSKANNIKSLKTIKSVTEYDELIKKTNDKHVKILKNKIDSDMLKNKLFYMYSKIISLATDEKLADEKTGKEHKKHEQEYYIKSEIIDLLISLEPTTDAIDLIEFEQKYEPNLRDKIYSGKSFTEILHDYDINVDEDILFETDPIADEIIRKFIEG